LSASCWSNTGELVITWNSRPWWITCLPPMYSMMALSPLASDSDRCSVVRRSSPGTLSVTTVKGCLRSASTASFTLP